MQLLYNDNSLNISAEDFPLPENGISNFDCDLNNNNNDEFDDE